MSAQSQSLSPLAVRLTLLVLAGVPEDLSLCERDGQRRWWLTGKRTTAPRLNGDRPGPGGPPASEGFQREVTLQPGVVYTLCGGQHTRISFLCPSYPCTVSIDPVGERVIFEGGPVPPVLSLVPEREPTPTPAPERTETPVVSEPTPKETDPHRIVGVPSVAGIVYPDGHAAMAALSALIGAGTVDRADLSGNPPPVRVVRGRAAPPPPPVPSVQDVPRGWDRVEPGPEQTAPVSVPAAPSREQIAARIAAVQSTARVVESVPEVQVAARKGTFEYTNEGYTVTPESVARVNEQVEHLRRFGFTPSRTAVPLGGTIVDVGRDKLVMSHRDWTEQPLLMTSMRQLQSVVRAEERIDVPCPRASEVSMREDGALVHPSWQGGFYPERGALLALVGEHSSVMPRAGVLMEQLTPRVRAEVWNDRVPHSLKSGASVLRTRKSTVEGERSVFAAVSPGYTALDADQIAGLVGNALSRMPGGIEVRGESLYDPENARTRIDGSWHADHVTNFSAGDTFKVGFRLQTHDGGGGAIRVSTMMLRNLCYNLIILDDQKQSVARVVHRGSQADMVRAVQAAIEHVKDFAQPFLKAWGYCQQMPIAALFERPSKSSEDNVLAVMRSLAGLPIEDMPGLPVLREGALPEGVTWEGIARDVVVEKLLSGFAHEPGEQVDSIVNAVTRMHTERVPVPVLAQAERNGGLLAMHLGTARA